MSEALMSYVEVTAPPNKRCDVLEIGCGSGLATAVLLRSTIECRRALLIDIEPEAILCTYKNLKLNGLVQSSRDLSRLSLLLGSFEPAEMCQSFDIVICNPPYVPYAPTRSVSTSDGLRMRAIAGLELITDLLLNLTPILTTNGVAVIIVNGATIDSLLQVFEALREDGFELTFLLGEDGLEVQFDLDEINSDQVWLSWLMDKGWVYERANILFHSIQAIAVRRLVQ
ncbi:methyltransferase [bacterium]|nr:methyltransferase [bacterium]